MLSNSTIEAMVEGELVSPFITPETRTRIYIYMLNMYMEQPTAYRTRGGGSRQRGDRDGNLKAISRLLGRAPFGVRYIIGQVDAWRDRDARFDDALSALEAKLDEAVETA